MNLWTISSWLAPNFPFKHMCYFQHIYMLSLDRLLFSSSSGFGSVQDYCSASLNKRVVDHFPVTKTAFSHHLPALSTLCSALLSPVSHHPPPPLPPSLFLSFFLWQQDWCCPSDLCRATSWKDIMTSSTSPHSSSRTSVVCVIYHHHFHISTHFSSSSSSSSSFLSLSFHHLNLLSHSYESCPWQQIENKIK